MQFGQQALSNGAPARRGLNRLDRRRVVHQLLADGRVRISLPRGGVLTDAEARRLAWAILNDLAPDEVVPAADVVTYAEAQRLAVIRALAVRPSTAAELTAALEWPLRVTQRRLTDLTRDGRVLSTRWTTPVYSLAKGIA